MTTVADIMTTSLVTVSPSEPCRRAATLMRDNGIGDVLVVHNGKLVGVLTDRDLAIRLVAQDGNPGASVASVFSGSLVKIHADADIREAVTLMREHGIRRIPVVSDGQPIGIVSIGDLAIASDPESALADVSRAPANA